MNGFLEFLLEQFQTGLGYSSMNTCRSAVSTLATIGGQPAGQHPLVRRFLKSVFQQRPALPRYTSTWNPDVVLQHIKRLGPNRHLGIYALSQKLTMLLLLLSGQRCQTIHLLDVRNMTLTPSTATFSIGDLTKTTRPGHHVPDLVFRAYAPDRRLCIHTALLAYLERTLDVRGAIKTLLLTTRKPYKAASRDTLRRWVRQLMGDAGLDLTMFAPHSTRAASTSSVATTLPLTTIIRTAGWTRESTFRRYYKKPVYDPAGFGTTVMAQSTK